MPKLADKSLTEPLQSNILKDSQDVREFSSK